MLRTVCVKQLGGGSTTIDDSNVVIVEDNFGNPLVVAVYISENVTTVVTPDDPDFNKILAGLGVDKIVVNNKLILDLPGDSIAAARRIR